MPGFPLLELPDEIIAIVFRCSKGAAARLRLGMACRTLRLASLQHKLWQNVHFHDEPSTAARLTDEALETLLRRVSARQHTVRLNLRDCFLVSGSGLKELVGSKVLRELDLRRGTGQASQPTGTLGNPAILNAQAIATLIQSCGWYALEQVYVGQAATRRAERNFFPSAAGIEAALRGLKQAQRRRRRRCDSCKLKSMDKESCPKPNCQTCKGPSVDVSRCTVCHKRSCGGKLDAKTKCPQMKSCDNCHWSACTACIDKTKAKGGMLFRKCKGCGKRVCKHRECKTELGECGRCGRAFCNECCEYCPERELILCDECYDESWSEWDSEGEEGWDDM